MSSSDAAPYTAAAKRAVMVVALVQLVNVLDFMMVMPLGPDFSKSLGIDPADIGIIGGSYTAAAALAGLVGAEFLDRFGRRRALAGAMFGLSLATIAGGLSWNMTSLVASRIAAGLFGGPATALSLAIVTDLVPPAHRGRAMGMASAAFPVASVFGIPAGLALSRVGGWHTPFFAIGALGFAVTALAATTLPVLRGHLGTAGNRPARRPAMHFLQQPPMRNALLAVGCMTFSIFLLVPNISVYLAGNLRVPRSNLEWMYLVGGVTAFTMMMIAGRVVDRFGSAPMSAAGTMTLMTAVATGFVAEPALLPVPVFFALFMASGSMRQVPMQALASKLPAPAERAQFMSLMSATSHTMSSLGAMIAARVLLSHDVIIGGQPTAVLDRMSWLATATLFVALPVPFLLWRIERAVKQAAPTLPKAVIS
jgi:predicted MFS family arabinose efflux permease